MSGAKFAQIKRVVAECCGTTVEAMDSRRRLAAPALARQIGMYYVSHLVNHLETTGRLFDRHHSNVVYARKRIGEMRDCDAWVSGVIAKVEELMPELREAVGCG